MLDLTGGHLVSYLLRQIKDIVSRNPRFRNTLGDVTFQNNQMVQWGNTQVVIRSMTASGTRLSPDYFMHTQHGRVTVAKLGEYEGSFIEWSLEIDKTRKTPIAGVYNLQVDYTSEKDQLVQLTLQQFKWSQGILRNAQGSVVHFNPTLGLDLTTLSATEAETGKVIRVSAFNSSTGGFMYVLTPCKTLVLTKPNGVTLNQNGSDYWYERNTSVLVCESSRGGSELMNLDIPFISATFQDQSGYILRPNLDYQWTSSNWINLSSSSPAGSQITAVVLQKLSPMGNSATNPENILNIGFTPGTDTLVANEVNIHTTVGDFSNVPVNVDGTVTLPTLLAPGNWLRYDVRIATPSVTIQGKKYTMNGFEKTIPSLTAPTDPSQRTVYLDPVTNQPVDPLPGLWLAMGDSVVVGDQCAIIVNPELTETYQVYGSKDNVSFTLDTKANDLQTASDLSELIKEQFLILKRENMERDGITILEAPRDMTALQRDISGLNTEYTYSQQFSGLADWKVYVPLVTRMVAFELTVSPYSSDFQGKLQLPYRITSVGASKFLTSYA